MSFICLLCECMCVYICIRMCVSPTHEPSSYKLLNLWTCILMSNHINRFMCLVYIVRYMDHLQVAGLLCTLVQNCIEDSSSVSLFQGQKVQEQSVKAVMMWPVLLYFSQCRPVRLKMFYFFVFVFMDYLCEKYYKPITIQY